jgi:hypothetical protein
MSAQSTKGVSAQTLNGFLTEAFYEETQGPWGNPEAPKPISVEFRSSDGSILVTYSSSKSETHQLDAVQGQRLRNYAANAGSENILKNFIRDIVIPSVMKVPPYTCFRVTQAFFLRGINLSTLFMNERFQYDGRVYEVYEGQMHDEMFTIRTREIPPRLVKKEGAYLEFHHLQVEAYKIFQRVYGYLWSTHIHVEWNAAKQVSYARVPNPAFANLTQNETYVLEEFVQTYQRQLEFGVMKIAIRDGMFNSSPPQAIKEEKKQEKPEPADSTKS